MNCILAPMATLSHEAFRRCVKKFGGCDEYFTEMINAGSLIHLGPFEKYYLMSGPEPEKIVWQITGSRSDYMARAAAEIAGHGGKGLDINMGCSAPQIANTGAGIAWMTKPIEQTREMVRSVKSALENDAKDGKTALRLSVKLRLGDEHFSQERFFSFTDMLVSEGVQMLTLHPRTKKEKFRSHARWNCVEELALRYPALSVVLNGDVKDRKSFEAAQKAAPHARGIMIARAAAQKPWIFREIADSTGTSFQIDCLETALDFISDVESCQPEAFWRTRLQRFFAYYCLNFSFAHYFQTQMLNAKDNDDARIRLSDYFEKCPADRIKTIPHEIPSKTE